MTWFFMKKKKKKKKKKKLSKSLELDIRLKLYYALFVLILRIYRYFMLAAELDDV